MFSGSEYLSVPEKSEVCRVSPFQQQLSVNLLSEWIERIPVFPENDPLHPEWKATPLLNLDLRPFGYGNVMIKDESCNPTGTIKDRPAWEIVSLYAVFARLKREELRSGLITQRELESMNVPRFSLISSGNEARSLAEAFKKFGLPPVKVLLDVHISPYVVDALSRLHADVYVADLGTQPLSGRDIKILTDNELGIDITSLKMIRPEEVFYDWHVFEVFNQRPDDVYLPFGSGRIAACYLYWQKKIVHGGVMGSAVDPRLGHGIDFREIMATNIFCAEPSEFPTSADKLYAPFKPFLVFNDSDIEVISRFGFSGRETGIHGVNEVYIQRAYAMMRHVGLQCEPSAAAGLALYLYRYERGLQQKDRRVIILNSGRGLIEENV